MKNLLQIGASAEAISRARGTIIDILRCKDADETTKLEALKAFTSVCSVNNATVSDCVFNGKGK